MLQLEPRMHDAVLVIFRFFFNFGPKRSKLGFY